MLQYDGLMQIDADGVPQNWLADSIEVSEDATVYTVELVEGVTWHDGEPLTADDVVFTYEYFPANPAASRFARDLNSVESVEATDELTVEITLGAPNPSFPLQALADVPIIPEHVWSKVDDPEKFRGRQAVMSTGPYHLKEHDPGAKSYLYEANEDYFLGTPVVRRMEFVPAKDELLALSLIHI